MSTTAERSMGVALRALNRLAQLELLDRAGLRRLTERALYETMKNGTKAATVAGRSFNSVTKLTQPARAPRSSGKGLFDVTPSEEQQFLVEALRDFAGAQLRPKALEADEACAAPAALLAQANELGVNTFGIPEALGGVVSEDPAITATLAAEALAHGDLSLAVAALAPGAVATAIGHWGNAEQQARYLEPFAGDDPPVAALALLEPHALFDPLALRTTARRDGDGFVLDGEKALVVRGADAELFVIGAMLEERPALFIVESADATGVTAAPEPAMGLRAAATARLRLQNVSVPASALLGDGSPAVYSECVARSRIAWAAVSVGCAQAVLDYVIPYVNERVAFGEPISHRQSVAFAVSDIGIETDGMRLATYRAASRADLGKEFAREAAVARELCVRHGMEIGSAGVQLLGGHGYIKEHPVERWYRDLRAAAVLEGTLLV